MYFGDIMPAGSGEGFGSTLGHIWEGITDFFGGAAAKTQAAAAQSAIDLQREQFNKLQEILAPYLQAGTGALSAQQALLGLSGPEAQAQAIQQIQNSPEMAALTQQGQNAILANASATGGLRGGNTQAALSQFQPALLNQLINQRMGQLGGLSGMGQNTALGQGGFGQNYAGNVGNLVLQQGAYQAGGQMIAPNLLGGLLNTGFQGLGLLKGKGAF